MARNRSKIEMQGEMERAIDTLDGAYTPETSREELAAAVGEALSILRSEDVEADEEDESGEYGLDDDL